jgi:PAS domain-containing protein
MPQQEVEVILTRQLASYLVMPVFIVGPTGDLLYYNEPAEAILGHRFDETGEMPMQEWSTVFEPTDSSGAALPPEELPLVIALRDRIPAHRAFWLRALDGARRHVACTAFPLEGQAGRFLGAVAIFWEMGWA